MICFEPKRRFGNALLRSIFAAGLALLACAPLASAQQNAPQPPPAATTVALPVTLPTEFDGDLRTLPQTYTPPQYYRLLNEFEGPPDRKPPPTSGSQPTQPSVRMLAPMPSPSANFPGLNFTTTVNGGQAGGGWPPDTNGDIGPAYYIQSVNTAMGVFNKSTGALVTAFTINQFWANSGTSTVCLNQNDGDPVILHDARNDRWFITDFAFAFSGGNPVMPFYECIAVSKTSDPVSGGWYFYAVRMDTGASGGPPAGTLNDYPKFGLWNDGCLYMGANGFSGTTYTGSIFASFSTTDMYAGNALTSSIGFLSSASGNEFSLFPADLLGSSAGSLPLAGTSEYFVAESQTAYAFDVRKFTPGANCGGGGTLSVATAVNQTSYQYNGGHYIPQPGTTNLLDSLEDRVMQRVQYRKIGSAESLWVVHTTGDGTTVPAQPQWAQINVSGGTIVTAPVQQQIYVPDTTEYRWMPSLAVDGSGDMAMGYSRSSSTAGDYPSIYYAGRLAGDAANSLPQSEVALITGGGSQTNACGTLNPCYRWGDYSSMTIDPSDDCTFWYTTEYYDTQAHGTAGNWQTRIGSFRFPGCVGLAAKLVFTVEPNSSYQSNTPITVKVSVEDAYGHVVTTNTSTIALTLSGGAAGATLGGTTSVAAVNGVATFSNLTVNKVGTNYVLNATDGSLTGTASTAFNITVGAPATISFMLEPGPNANLTAGSTIPLIAHVADSGGNPVPGDSVTLAIGNNAGGSTLGVASNPVTTDANGNASFSNVSLNKAGTGYSLTASDATPLTATSNSFNIVAGAASQLVFTTQPADVMQGNTQGTIAVAEEDANGNIVASDSTSTVDFTVSACGGPVDLGSATMASGAATLSNSTQRFYTVAAGLTVGAASSGTFSGTASSGTFNVTSNSGLIFSDGFDGCRL